jgi:hypothetical protein
VPPMPPDAGVGADAALPYLRPNRENVMAMVRAQIRMVACIEAVYGEEAYSSLGDFQMNLNELNPRAEPGYLGVFRRMLDCDMPELDCEAFLECIDIRASPACEGTTFSGIGACGTEDTRIWCQIGATRGPVTYCRESGGSCPEYSAASGGCYYGRCGEPMGTCRDGTRFDCLGGLLLVAHPCEREAPCVPLGPDWSCARYWTPVCRRMQEEGQVAPRCVADGEPCDTWKPARCIDDRTVEGCTWPGYVSRLDCDAFFEGARCDPNYDAELGAACTVPGKACRHSPKCDDDRYLQTCPLGEWERIDCAEMGMECSKSSFLGVETGACRFPRD